MIEQLMSKGALGTGLVSQPPELTHLVTNIKQEWDSNTQSYKYQLQSFTNNNDYFIVDLGTNIDQIKEGGLVARNRSDSNGIGEKKSLTENALNTLGFGKVLKIEDH